MPDNMNETENETAQGVAAQATILDIAQTEIGTFYLSRRSVAGVAESIYEISIGDEVLMTSLSPVSERALSSLALQRYEGDGPLRVLVGGLGLGYTAQAALADPRVESVCIVEKMEFVIRWMKEGKLPLSQQLQEDSRVEIMQGDIYSQLLGTATLQYDLILVDVDHAPSAPLSDSSQPFYTAQGQRAVAQHLKPGGVLGVWSIEEDETFASLLAQSYAFSHTEEVCWQDQEFPEADYQNTVFLAKQCEL